MKILRLIATMDPSVGGPCQGIRNAASELNRMGVINEVVCLDDPTASFLGNDPFVIHALGRGVRPWCYHAELLPWLVANLPRYDVLIVHGLWLYPSFAARIAHKRLQKRAEQQVGLTVPKLFIMPHGMLDPWFQQAPTRRLKAFRNELYWKLIEHKVVRDADGLLFTTETELQMARSPFWPYQPKREVNVGYGIQPPPPYTLAMQTAFRQCCPALSDEPYLLFLGRIHEKKGVDLLIKAYASIISSPSYRTKLVIAGPGLETTFGQTIQRLVAETPGLSKRIFFPGMLTGLAKWGSLYGCEAFVLPSHQENFGIAVAEALACGKPVLISDQVNIWREIKSNGGGLVDTNTLEGTQHLIQQWQGLPQTARQTMAKRAHDIFMRYYSIELFVERLINIISV